MAKAAMAAKVVVFLFIFIFIFYFVYVRMKIMSLRVWFDGEKRIENDNFAK